MLNAVYEVLTYQENTNVFYNHLVCKTPLDFKINLKF